ncbi:MAG: hypothetical protein ACLP1X_02495 [Polyangiaceae bacterium]
MNPIAEAAREIVEPFVQKVLGGEKLDGGKTIADGVLVLVDKLKAHQEEGVDLRPHVCIFREEDHQALNAAMDSDEVHLFEIAHSAPRTLDSFAKAVKHCAPLAQGPWCVFIKLRQGDLAYGVMRRRYGTTEPYILPSETGNGTLIWLHPVEKHLLRLSCAGPHHAEVDFRVAPGGGATSSYDARQSLFNCLLQGAWKTQAPALRAVFEDAIDRALVHGHGFLIAISDRSNEGTRIQHNPETWVPKPPEAFRNRGLLFNQWLIPTQLKVASLFSYQFERQTHSPAALESRRKAQELAKTDPVKFSRNMTRAQAEVEAWIALIATLLMSDGITWFDTSGRVLGFRIFLPTDVNASEGGARTRAFRKLEELVNQKELRAAFMQSQDGAAKFVSR